MANYFQWRNKHPENKLLYYICGVEEPLRMEVLDAVIAQYDAEVTHVKAKNGFSEIESAVLSEPARLHVVVIHDADKLDEGIKDIIQAWAVSIYLGKLMRTVLIVYTGEDNPDTAQAFYRPFVEKGRFVECKQLSGDSLKKYAVEGYNLTETAAEVLMELVSYNFLQMNNELEKFAIMNYPVVDEAIVRKLVVFSADNLFLSHMLARNATQASKVVSAVPASTIAYVLTQLTKKLTFLYLVITNDTPGTSAHKLAAILQVQPWQLLEYFAIKKAWNLTSIQEALRAIVYIEHIHSQHATNVLPLLVTWWR